VAGPSLPTPEQFRHSGQEVAAAEDEARGPGIGMTQGRTRNTAPNSSTPLTEISQYASTAQRLTGCLIHPDSAAGRSG
jgi:hypothetical protein